MSKSHSESIPINRSTLSGQVAERLRADITSGVYQPGGQLNEALIARQFGVSRGPLREAMQRLIQDGLLRSRPHRGVFVPELTDEDLVDIYFAREAIEIAALRRIMASGQSVEVARLLRIEVDMMIAALERDDWSEVVDHDLHFHTQLVDAAQSRRLSRMYSVLIDETRLCLHMLVSGFTGRKDFVEEHIALADRLAAEDTPGALKAIRNHLNEPLKSLAQQRDDQGKSRYADSPGETGIGSD
ncbi:MAG: GntR family transcriptional regulator [Gammaproteobacteria bacterium]|nr:GntR family transcriptional regulator [Gammaproteobacteria bacterium]